MLHVQKIKIKEVETNGKGKKNKQTNMLEPVASRRRLAHLWLHAALPK